MGCAPSEPYKCQVRCCAVAATSGTDGPVGSLDALAEYLEGEADADVHRDLTPSLARKDMEQNVQAAVAASGLSDLKNQERQDQMQKQSTSTRDSEDLERDDQPVLVRTLTAANLQAHAANTPKGELRLSLSSEAALSGEASLSSATSKSKSSRSSASSKYSERSTRSSTRHACRKVKVTETMGFVTSAALQFVISNTSPIAEKYKFEETLGEGGFGKVRLAKAKATGARRAIKSISMAKMKEHTDALKSEINIMKMVDHPSILMMFEIYEEDEELHLALELCSGGDLEERVINARGSCLPDAEAANAMRQLLTAVNYLHGRMIVHRDLKSANILTKVGPSHPLGRSSLKVSDFGLSCIIMEGRTLTTKCGTLTHMAPEVLEKKYDQRCDIWSCGVILYFILSGQLPFKTEEEIAKGRYKMTAKPWIKVSQAAVSLMSMLLAKRPSTRFSARRALREEWLADAAHAGQEKIAGKATILQELQAFRHQNKFKRAVLNMAARMMPDSESSESRELFSVLDADGDGVISAKDLKAAGGLVSGLGNQCLSSSQVDAVLRDGHGEVKKPYGYTEFLAATMNPKFFMSPKFLRVAFDSFDKDGDKSISLSELSNGHLLGSLSMEELHEILQDHDANGDSQLDYSEFVQMMSRAASVS